MPMPRPRTGPWPRPLPAAGWGLASIAVQLSVSGSYAAAATVPSHGGRSFRQRTPTTTQNFPVHTAAGPRSAVPNGTALIARHRPVDGSYTAPTLCVPRVPNVSSSVPVHAWTSGATSTGIASSTTVAPGESAPGTATPFFQFRLADSPVPVKSSTAATAIAVTKPTATTAVPRVPLSTRDAGPRIVRAR